jgi:hypothetical protein
MLHNYDILNGWVSRQRGEANLQVLLSHDIDAGLHQRPLNVPPLSCGSVVSQTR